MPVGWLGGNCPPKFGQNSRLKFWQSNLLEPWDGEREWAVSSQNAKIWKSHYLQNRKSVVNPIKPTFEDKAETTYICTSCITLNQIQHGWRPPSWKSPWRRNSAVDVQIPIKFGMPVENHMPMTMKKPKSKPEVEFQYGSCLFSKTGSTAVDWDTSIWSKFGMLIASDLKWQTWLNQKPEVDLRRYGRHVVKSIWRHSSVNGHSICVKFRTPMTVKRSKLNPGV